MNRSLVNIFRQHVATTPGAPCLTFQGETQSYKQVNEIANRVANRLGEVGVGVGDRVAIVAQNAPIFYELAFACAKIGAVMLPLNWRLSAREIRRILDDGAPKIVFSGAKERHLLPEGMNAIPNLDIETQYPAWRNAAPAVEPERPVDPDDPWFILYTSGTTGEPKGVTLTHRNLSYTAAIAQVWGFSSDSVNLLVMPLFHIGGIGNGMMGLSQGGETLLIQRSEPASILSAIERHRVTHGFFVPTVINDLLSIADVESMDLTSLRLIAYGASPISETLLKRAIEVFKCNFSHAYGLTEAAGTVTRLPSEDHDPGGPRAGRLNSCGLPFPWIELALWNPESGEQVRPGEEGEIWVRSEMNMPGYWNKPTETVAVLTPEGWLRTGDVAYQDADGYLYLRDRYKDMIVSGGENIYPVEVENVLYEHPGVSEVAVIGIPHSRWGETPKAIVVAFPGTYPTEPELIDFVRLRLAHYKSPTSVEFVSQLPRNASGKLLKHRLRALYLPKNRQP